jgi:hypothetical protein
MASVGILSLLGTVMFLARSSGPETRANQVTAKKIPMPLPARKSVSFGQANPATNKPRVLEAYGKLPMAFEANRGQADGRVKFPARGSRYTVFLTSNEAVLTLRKPFNVSDGSSAEGNPNPGNRDAAGIVAHAAWGNPESNVERTFAQGLLYV